MIPCIIERQCTRGILSLVHVPELVAAELYAAADKPS